ncbi:MAG: outer membrane beta-barrel protein [Acidobacteriota bacterium]
MFRNTGFCVALLTLIWLTMPTTASAEGEGWQLRIGGVWVDPDVSFIDIDTDGDRVEAGTDGGFGFGAALEKRFSSRLGLEVGVLFAEPDVTLFADLGPGLQFFASDSVSFTAATLGLNVHLTPDRAVDLYLGPLVSYVQYGDIGFLAQAGGTTLAQEFSTRDDFTLGAQVGADFRLGERPWTLNLAAKWIDTSLEVTSEDGEVTDLGFEPIILGFGVGYRF